MSKKSAAAVSEAEQKKFLQLLADWAKEGENAECADCTAAYPDWASVNIGVYICIRCAGVHRSLGTHISFVRSISMDKWTPQHMEVIRNVGNAKARLFYEANKPANRKKPMERDSTDPIVKEYIHDKYVRRAWIPKGVPAPHALRTSLTTSTSKPPAVATPVEAPPSPAQKKTAISSTVGNKRVVKKKKIVKKVVQNGAQEHNGLTIVAEPQQVSPACDPMMEASSPSSSISHPNGIKFYIPTSSSHNDDEEEVEIDEEIEEDHPHVYYTAQPLQLEIPDRSPLVLAEPVAAKSQTPKSHTPKAPTPKTSAATKSVAPVQSQSPKSKPQSSTPTKQITPSASPASARREKMDSILSMFVTAASNEVAMVEKAQLPAAPLPLTDALPAAVPANAGDPIKYYNPDF